MHDKSAQELLAVQTQARDAAAFLGAAKTEGDMGVIYRLDARVGEGDPGNTAPEILHDGLGARAAGFREDVPPFAPDAGRQARLDFRDGAGKV